MAILFGGILLYLGALNALLALTIETCTMGSADSLMGGVLTIVLNAVGFGLLALCRRRVLVLAFAAIPAIMAIYYTAFAMKFASGHVLSDMTACQAMTGAAYEADGREVYQILIWIAVALTFWIGCLIAVIRSKRAEGDYVERTDEN